MLLMQTLKLALYSSPWPHQISLMRLPPLTHSKPLLLPQKKPMPFKFTWPPKPKLLLLFKQTSLLPGRNNAVLLPIHRLVHPAPTLSHNLLN
jgi:hypothetical protein